MSKKTLEKFLQGVFSISAGTAANLEDAAEEVAADSKGKSSDAIAVIGMNIQRPLYSGLAKAAEFAAKKTGCNIDKSLF